MAENIATTETQATEPEATTGITVSSMEEYREQRAKGTAPGKISWRSTEPEKTPEPKTEEAAKPESEAEPQTNEQVASEEEQSPKEPEQTEQPKTPEGDGKRKSLIEDVQKQRQRAQQAERERDELKAEIESYKKTRTTPESKPAEPAKEAKSEAPKLEHPGKPPKFTAFSSIEEYDEATAAYLEKLADFKSAQIEQRLSAAYETAEAEKEKKSKKAAEESEVQTLNQKFNERLEKSAKQFPELIEKLKDAAFPISGEMADIIRRDEQHGVAMANYLVSHPEESLRIAQMRRHMDIGMAMGDIRATVRQAVAPTTKAPETKPKTSNAPQPPVNTGGGGSVGSTLEELATRAGNGDGTAFLAFKAKRMEQLKAANARR